MLARLRLFASRAAPPRLRQFLHLFSLSPRCFLCLPRERFRPHIQHSCGFARCGLGMATAVPAATENQEGVKKPPRGGCWHECVGSRRGREHSDLVFPRSGARAAHQLFQRRSRRPEQLLNDRPLQWKFLGDMSRIVATSPNYLATSDVLAKYKHKVSVIPIGLDKATYPVPSPDKLTYWRERLGPKFFLFVGVIRYYKGLHILIEAAQGTDYPIVIVGAGPIEEELKTQAAQLGLRNIHFLGFLPDADKVALLTLCYSVLFPSHLRSEAFGISLLEGAMYGKPMISSEIGTGTTFINIGDETGLVVPPSDPVAMRQAMRYLWEHPEQAAAMGRRAEARYWEHFTADQMVGEYVKLYRELAGITG